MSLVPTRLQGEVILKGVIPFCITHQGQYEIKDSFRLKITIPKEFPRALPIFEELDNKIPKTPDFHVNKDGTLCLGSPLRLYTFLSQQPDIVSYIDQILLPYLYAVSRKLASGEHFVFGELAHGNLGEITDYCDLFGIHNENCVLGILYALSIKRRIANKRLCPCGCGKKLGQCKIHLHLNKFRGSISRKIYLDIYIQLKRN